MTLTKIACQGKLLISKEYKVSGRYERVGISIVEVYERVPNSVISVCKKAQKGFRCISVSYARATFSVSKMVYKRPG